MKRLFIIIFMSIIVVSNIFADPNAPGQPLNFTLEPDISGALEAQLNWINPALCINGEPLTELSEICVFRNDLLIFTETSPIIGEPYSYIDSSVPDNGMYDYHVLGFNSFGSGTPAIASAWVGEDVPAAVTDFILIYDTQTYTATLTWTNPTEGLHGGAFNEQILGYHLERSDGCVFEITGIQTGYIDNTITVPGYYSYTIIPYNSVGDGGIAETNIPWWPYNVFNVYIICDDYPSETTWDIVDDGGNVLYSDGPYTLIGEIADVDCVLAEGDYTFTIYDAFGDGICCDHGIGFYILTLDSVVIMEGGEFGYFESTSFIVEAGAVPGYIDGTVYLDGGTGNVEDVEVEAGGVIVNPAADGTYSIELQPGIHNVTAYLAGYETGLIEDVVVTEGNTTSEVDFTLTFVTEGDEIIIAATKLNGNYPNPFNPVTTIVYSIKNAGYVTIEVYNLKGQKVKRLVNDRLSVGQHEVLWNGKDDSGKNVTSGIYFCRFKSDDVIQTKRMLMLK